MGRPEPSSKKPSHLAKAANLATDDVGFGNCSGFSSAPAQPASLCDVCNVRPRLGALSRCAACLRAAADVDRQSRIHAEARSVPAEPNARKVKSKKIKAE